MRCDLNGLLSICSYNAGLNSVAFSFAKLLCFVLTPYRGCPELSLIHVTKGHSHLKFISTFHTCSG